MSSAADVCMFVCNIEGKAKVYLLLHKDSGLFMIFQYMGICFVWNFKGLNFKGGLCNSTQNILLMHWIIRILYKVDILRALGFGSSYVFFLNATLSLSFDICRITNKSNGKFSRLCQIIGVSSPMWDVSDLSYQQIRVMKNFEDRAKLLELVRRCGMCQTHTHLSPWPPLCPPCPGPLLLACGTPIMVLSSFRKCINCAESSLFDPHGSEVGGGMYTILKFIVVFYGCFVGPELRVQPLQSRASTFCFCVYSGRDAVFIYVAYCCG